MLERCKTLAGASLLEANGLTDKDANVTCLNFAVKTAANIDEVVDNRFAQHAKSTLAAR